MVDENKVKLMTRLAIYEKHEKDRSLVYSKYFQTDYVRYNVLKTLVAATVVYWAVLGYYAFMNFDSLLAKVSDVDYFDIMYKLLGAYVAFCAVYFIIATLVYNYRYSKSKDGLIQYNSDLRDLIELEGGPMHHARLVKKGERTVSQDYSKPAAKETAAQASPRTTVNRSEIVRKKQMEQEKLKEEEIKQNAARLAARAKANEQKERQAAADRAKIQERRRQLEREQLERIRREQQQMMNRENHTYSGNSSYSQNAMSGNYSGNINRTNARTGVNGSATNGNYEGRNR